MNSRDPIRARAIKLARMLERESAEVGRTRYTTLSRVLMLASSSLLDAVADEMSMTEHDENEDGRYAIDKPSHPEGSYR